MASRMVTVSEEDLRKAVHSWNIRFGNECIHRDPARGDQVQQAFKVCTSEAHFLMEELRKQGKTSVR